MNAPLDNANLRRENGILASKHVKTEARSHRNAVILLVGQGGEQLGCESYCVMVAGAAFLCSGLVDRSKRIEDKLTELTIRKTCCVLWRKRY